MSKRNGDDGLAIFVFLVLAAAFVLPVVAAGASVSGKDRSNPAKKLVIPFGAIGLTVAAICGWTLVWPLWLSVVLTVFACLALFAAII